AGNDIIQGNSRDNRLDGRAGSDTYIFAGSALGTDTVVEAANADSDTLNFLSLDGSVDINLARTDLWDVSAGILRLRLTSDTGIENVFGSRFNDVIRGNSRDNMLAGAEGNDRLKGREGMDTLFGDQGDDDLFGDEGTDILRGGAGRDLLDGGHDGSPGGELW